MNRVASKTLCDTQSAADVSPREDRETDYLAVQTGLSPRTTPRTTSPQNGTEAASRNPNHKDMNILRGWTPSS